eukprot:TRINITY_DN16208_c0_g1_i1.p1 TRINITY_DN16208_c0_g1~~TRINITY_DN16208_c0_g1_i1.p1  ORF type:complete len:956 (+),score=133.82 TRINITY_DN16208_c0_g1_i1:190-3057(+)
MAAEDELAEDVWERELEASFLKGATADGDPSTHLSSPAFAPLTPQTQEGLPSKRSSPQVKTHLPMQEFSRNLLCETEQESRPSLRENTTYRDADTRIPASATRGNSREIGAERVASRLTFAFPGWGIDICKGEGATSSNRAAQLPSVRRHHDDRACEVAGQSKWSGPFEESVAKGLPGSEIRAACDGRPCTLFSQTPDDVLLHILIQLSVKDICSLVCVSKRCRQVAGADGVWESVTQRECVAGGGRPPMISWRLWYKRQVLAKRTGQRFLVLQKGHAFLRAALDEWWAEGSRGTPFSSDATADNNPSPHALIAPSRHQFSCSSGNHSSAGSVQPTIHGLPGQAASGNAECSLSPLPSTASPLPVAGPATPTFVCLSSSPIGMTSHNSKDFTTTIAASEASTPGSDNSSTGNLPLSIPHGSRIRTVDPLGSGCSGIAMKQLPYSSARSRASSSAWKVESSTVKMVLKKLTAQDWSVVYEALDVAFTDRAEQIAEALERLCGQESLTGAEESEEEVGEEGQRSQTGASGEASTELPAAVSRGPLEIDKGGQRGLCLVRHASGGAGLSRAVRQQSCAGEALVQPFTAAISTKQIVADVTSTGQTVATITQGVASVTRTEQFAATKEDEDGRANLPSCAVSSSAQAMKVLPSGGPQDHSAGQDTDTAASCPVDEARPPTLGGVSSPGSRRGSKVEVQQQKPSSKNNGNVAEEESSVAGEVNSSEGVPRKRSRDYMAELERHWERVDRDKLGRIGRGIGEREAAVGREMWTQIVRVWPLFKRWLKRLADHCGALQFEVMLERSRALGVAATPTLSDKGAICFRERILLRFGVRRSLQAGLTSLVAGCSLRGAPHSGAADVASDGYPMLLRAVRRLYQELDVADDMTGPSIGRTQPKLQRCFEALLRPERGGSRDLVPPGCSKRAAAKRRRCAAGTSAGPSRAYTTAALLMLEEEADFAS